MQEGHFLDVKAIEIAPAKLTKTLSALSNAEGGEVYIGIAETRRRAGCAAGVASKASRRQMGISKHLKDSFRSATATRIHSCSARVKAA